MIRLAVLAALLLLAVWEWFSGPNKALYIAAVAGLFAFFSFRYGQGQDYLNYLSIFETIKPLQMLPNYFLYSFNKIDVGYFYLISFLKMLHVNFTVFIFIITGGSLLLIDRFIRKFSPLPLLSLAVFYAVYSITYMESGLRQLIALCLILGFALPEWHRGKKMRACLVILIAATMHMSVLLVLAVLPIFFFGEQKKEFGWKIKPMAIIFGIVLAGSAVINFVPLSPILTRIPGQVGSILNYYYTTSRSLSLPAIGNRLLFTAIACALAYRARERLSARDWFLFKLYLIGFVVYIAFMSIDLIASRTNVYFRIIEFALLPSLLYLNKDLGNKILPALAAFLLVISFIYVKDIRAVMQFGQYFSNNPLEYSYITIFDPAQIMEKRYIPVAFEPYMNQAAYGEFDFNEYYRKVLRKPSHNSPYLPY
ncbi:MAG: EpsG family protein [Oscillospiraceae bacterium]|jgi:hypothetical protein|nr:EpsG family protein [Oscillospiraceae bacterium]